MVLRGRDKLNRPKRMEDYVTLAEVFLADCNEPKTFVEAVNCDEHVQWKLAMDEEIKSLQEN